MLFRSDILFVEDQKKKLLENIKKFSNNHHSHNCFLWGARGMGKSSLIKYTVKKINDEILNLKKTLMNLNFQKSSGQLEKTSRIKDTKKQIARLNTKLSNINGEKNA